ncbi:phage terminase large subunit family protein [Ralstonia sp. CHL-2022]|uniref:Phage terminase large subunit family protein n=1 Tax=Ralstonia mojiangensis TaxID=2953895 RepID=A0AAE3LDQ4_9RALS|nr:phage terminase large subunit family protein [Ralstonia mojiangensis]MCT7319400.1 phage terminase large subunit family protein [Ralstonia mojiangensis]
MSHPDGAALFARAFLAGLKPDPELWVDQWSEEFMVIPDESGAAETGPYRSARTPYAVEPMQCLSPAHPCLRVVAMVASQLFKTQIALNWISATIHRAPANFLALQPTLNLTRRFSARVAKTLDAVPVLRERVASARSRDAANTAERKDFRKGTLFINTAGSAANLAEVSARYLYGDEIDRWVRDLNNEGDPIGIAEKRASTFGRNAKFYYSSSPTIDGASRIAELYAQSDQRRYYVACPHCGHEHILEFEQLRASDDLSDVYCECPACFYKIREHEKPALFKTGRWIAHAQGDGETVGFHLSTMYAPLGWVSWRALVKEHREAKLAMEKGDPGLMQVFYNTRLARLWDNAQQRTSADELRDRAEDYRLRTVPAGALLLTAAVDTQDDRLELLIMGWGEGMERWTIDHQVFMGDPSDATLWATLDEALQATFLHASGKEMQIRAVAIDSGGSHTQDVYHFTRLRQWRHVLAVKGASKPNRPVIAQRPSRVDVTWQGTTEVDGAELWIVGTDTAKDWIYNRFKLTSGPGTLHFSNDLPMEFYKQLTAEKQIVRYVKGFPRTEWVKARGDRNEILDLNVYNLAAAYYLGVHKYQEPDWRRLRLHFDQGSLFAAAPVNDEAPQEAAVPLAAEPPRTAHTRRRVAASRYLKRR